jgi:hypothetical protein
MSVELNEAGAGVIGEDGQLQLFRVEFSRPEAAGLVWREPPADRRVLLTPEIVEQLRARPGRWAVLREYHHLSATHRRAGQVKHPVDIELRGAAQPPGWVLYARAKPAGDAR